MPLRTSPKKLTHPWTPLALNRLSALWLSPLKIVRPRVGAAALRALMDGVARSVPLFMRPREMADRQHGRRRKLAPA